MSLNAPNTNNTEKPTPETSPERKPGSGIEQLFAGILDTPETITECYDKKPGETFSVDRTLEIREISQAFPPYMLSGFITDSTGSMYKVERTFEKIAKPVAQTVEAKDGTMEVKNPAEQSKESWMTVHPSSMKITKLTGENTGVLNDFDEHTLHGPLQITHGFGLWNLENSEKERLEIDSFITAERQRSINKTRKRLSENLKNNKSIQDLKKGLKDLVSFLSMFGFQPNYQPPIRLQLDHAQIQKLNEQAEKAAYEKHKTVKVEVKKEEEGDKGHDHEDEHEDTSTAYENYTTSHIKENPNIKNNPRSLALNIDPNATLHIPVQKTELSSPYGMRGGRMHGGFDIAVPVGTPVATVADGKVIAAGFDNANGHYVTVEHKHLGIKTKYIHLSEISVQKDQSISGGVSIGKSGNTGASRGPHLHMHMYDLKTGKTVNPNQFSYKMA